VSVLVRGLEDSGIAVRATVMTNTVEENFAACSDLRRRMVWRFAQEPDVEFAYPHMQLVEPGKVQRQE
jgi:small-conductance mechanosensitive channel